MNPIVMTWAKCEAQKAVKRELRARGEKIAYISRRQIVEAANAYLEAHPELIEQAERMVRKSPALQAMSKRHERGLINRSKLRSAALKRKPLV